MVETPTDADGPFLSDARIRTCLYEKKQNMLHAMEADCMEWITIIAEVLEMILQGFY